MGLGTEPGLRFVKMHGLGNDYVFVNCIDLDKEFDWPELSRQVSRPHFGIGSDGLILIMRSEKADLRMRIFNADGSEGEMCGNGIRCFARYAYERGLVQGKKTMEVQTLAGIVKPEIVLDGDGKVASVRVDMGKPVTVPRGSIPVKCDASLENVPMLDEEVRMNDRRFRVSAVSMGNPHCVVFFDDESELAQLALDEVGPFFEGHKMFPNRTNVEFATALSADHVKARVWERGSGATMACGTGACAVLVAGVLTGRCSKKARVELPGGTLEIEWREQDGHVMMTGGAVSVFEGTYYGPSLD